MEKTNRIGILIPCFNEVERFKMLNWSKQFETYRDVDFLFINDGSSDQTQNVLDTFSKEFENVFCLSLLKNSGKAEAIRQGIFQFNIIQYDYVAYLDADLATPVSELIRISQFLLQNGNLALVMGARIKLTGNQVRRSLVRHYFGRVFATIVSQVILKFPIYDTQCGAKVMRSDLAYRLFKDPFITKWLFDVELLLRFKRSDREFELKIKEIPLEIWEEKGGSKIRKREFFQFPLQLLKIYFNYV